jgi:hypothetical protein
MRSSTSALIAFVSALRWAGSSRILGEIESVHRARSSLRTSCISDRWVGPSREATAHTIRSGIARRRCPGVPPQDRGISLGKIGGHGDILDWIKLRNQVVHSAKLVTKKRSANDRRGCRTHSRYSNSNMTDKSDDSSDFSPSSRPPSILAARVTAKT